MWKGYGSKGRCISKEDNIMYVPILETIQCLLRNETVLSEVRLSDIHICNLD